MQIYYTVGSEDGLDRMVTTHAEYEKASAEARNTSAMGATTVIYKCIPVARFVAKVTVTEEVDECAV
jgi:hypothetical protein